MMSKITSTAQKVLEERYFLDGETCWGDLSKRVSFHFGNDGEEVQQFKQVLDNMDFLPNSPCLMNAGTSIHAYSACYVLPVEDSIDSIFKYYSDAGLISKSGGGVGANFSNIRGCGSIVNSTDGVASGPISFAVGQDALTEVIKQGGRRRGANMGILMCDHTDIWDWVKAKDEPDTLTNFNLSVGITDEFMGSILDEDRDKTAEGWHEDNQLWDELVKRAWSSAEPGVLFMDTIEAGNTVPHLGKLEATNPCGEQPLLPYESCTLGSINLSNHVVGDAVDWDKLRRTVHTGTLFLNRILDASTMPIPECQDAMELTRKIGLGIMGLHDMLIQLGLPYDSEEGRKVAGQVMKFIAEEADKKSRELGHTEGCFTGWDGDRWRRNANLTTIAPTGTLSMIADCSSGCEPYYAPVTYKTVLDGTEFAMPNKWLSWMAEGFEETMEETLETHWDLFKGAGDIDWRDHILMQAELQKYVDSSISKTINMPNEATVEEVKEAYELSYTTGCKGVTIYRDGSRDEQILDTKRKRLPRESSEATGSTDNRTGEETYSCKAILGDTLNATRYKIRVKDQKVYVIIAEDEAGKPMEVFAKFPFEGGGSWNTLCRSISLSLRYGVPLEEVISQLDKSVMSVNDLPSNLSRILKMYMQSKGSNVGSPCPDCGTRLIFEEGCEHCGSCGYSKCG